MSDKNNTENGSQLLELAALRKERALEKYLALNSDIVNPSDVAQLIEVKAGPTGEVDFSSVDAALNRLRQKAPMLFRSERVSMGLRDTAKALPEREPSDREKAEKFFGPNANAAAANRLCLSSPAGKTEYRRLKSIAEKMGIL